MYSTGGGGAPAGSGRSFPALGFDPAPGDPGTVATVLTSITAAAIQLDEVNTRMAQALDVSDDWDGDAADDFHDYGDDLPTAFGTGAESMKAVVEALSTWAGQLSANQARADELERLAKQLKARLEAAKADRWSTLNTALRKVIEDARRLQARHLRQANAAASAVRGGPDDAFQPQNDDFWVQAADGIATVSDITSAVTGAAALGLAATGIGAPVAGALGAISAGTQGLSLAAGLAQRGLGSSNAPGNLDLLLNVVPARTVTSGLITGARRAAKPAIGTSRAANAARGLREGAAEGFTSGGFPALARELRDFQEVARRVGVGQALKSKAATAGVIMALTEQRELAGRALAGSVDVAVKSLDASGVELTAGQRRELEALKFAANPGQEQAEKGAINVIKGK